MNRFLLLLASLLLFVNYSCSQTDKPMTKDKKYTYLVPVEGMSCMSCASRVKGALKEIEGVGEIKVDLASKQVEIQADDTLSQETIRNVIKNAGYKPGDPELVNKNE